MPNQQENASFFDHGNINNLSSIMGSFMNLGRPSDMNEDRIISKETQEALRAKKIGNFKQENPTNEDGYEEISQIDRD